MDIRFYSVSKLKEFKPEFKGYFVNLYDRAQVKKDIDKIKDKTDLIIVSMHFDNSNDFIPSNYPKEEAK